MSNLVVDALIEIPTGSRNKYEFDKEKGRYVLDRVLYSPMFYPAEYGYLEGTLALDGDPLDILVLSSFPTFPGCLIESRVIGVLVMSDDKGQDEKLLAVPKSDPRFKDFNALEDVPQHVLKEIAHFFQVYKDLENKKTEIEGWKDAAFAKQLYEDCVNRYNNQ